MPRIEIPTVPVLPTEGDIIEARAIIKKIEEGTVPIGMLSTETKRDFKYSKAIMQKAGTIKKAYGGYVKKYAKGGGVRKVRR